MYVDDLQKKAKLLLSRVKQRIICHQNCLRNSKCPVRFNTRNLEFFMKRISGTNIASSFRFYRIPSHVFALKSNGSDVVGLFQTTSVRGHSTVSSNWQSLVSSGLCYRRWAPSPSNYFWLVAPIHKQRNREIIVIQSNDVVSLVSHLFDALTPRWFASIAPSLSVIKLSHSSLVIRLWVPMY